MGEFFFTFDNFSYNYLFQVMGFAGIRVKTELIKILNEFLLPLGSALKPCAVGLVAGVLHGLEEGSDFYDRLME